MEAVENKISLRLLKRLARSERKVLVAFQEASFVYTLGRHIAKWDSEQRYLGGCLVSFLES